MIKYFIYIIFVAWMPFLHLGGCGKNNYTQPTKSNHNSESRTTAVIYAYYGENAIDIRLQEIESEKYRVIYKTNFKKHAPDIPDEFGFLPSPNGNWILVWESTNKGEATQQNVTLWKIVRVRDLEIIELGSQVGKPALLPYWESPDLLLINGENKTNKYNLSLGTDLDTLPSPISISKRREILIEYCSNYFSHELEILSGILDSPERSVSRIRLSRAWEIGPKEYPILRALGIPGLGSLISEYRQFPQVSISSDGERFVFTDAWEDAPVIGTPPGNQFQLLYPSRQEGTRIEVWEATTERMVWYEEHAQEFRPGSAFTQPPQDKWIISWFVDPRWSQDGKYLSYSILNKKEPRIQIIDTNSWREIFDASDSVNPFVIQMQK